MWGQGGHRRCAAGQAGPAAGGGILIMAPGSRGVWALRSAGRARVPSTTRDGEVRSPRCPAPAAPIRSCSVLSSPPARSVPPLLRVPRAAGGMRNTEEGAQCPETGCLPAWPVPFLLACGAVRGPGCAPGRASSPAAAVRCGVAGGGPGCPALPRCAGHAPGVPAPAAGRGGRRHPRARAGSPASRSGPTPATAPGGRRRPRTATRSGWW